MARLVTLIERYGDAIEYDLHAVFGLDLLDFFRHRYTWRKLDVLLAQLPSGSAFWAARADDDEAAAAVLKANQGRRPAGGAPPLTEMTTTNQLLLDLIDMQQVIVQRITQLGGGKPGTINPAPRPDTGMSRAKRNVEAQHVEALVAEAHAAQARAEAAQGGTLAPAD